MSALASNILLGVVQGVTEWLPISSTGHLAIVERWLGIEQELAFDVLLHVASLAVMSLYFRRDIANLTRAALRNFESSERRLVWYIVAATAITVVLGLVLAPFEKILRNVPWLIVGLLVNAGALFAVRGSGGSRTIDLRTALLVGAAQGIAVVPSLSRSGLTIAVALLMGARREEAFRFSFFIAMPAIAAAVVYELPQLSFRPEYLVGLLVTFAVSFGSLSLLRSLVLRDRFHWFWVYNFILALILIPYA